MRKTMRMAAAAGVAAAAAAAILAGRVDAAGKVPVQLRCPAQKVTVGVETPASFPAPWWDTPFVMQLKSVSTSLMISGKPALTCIYEGSGREWTVARPVAPQFKSCSVSGDHFVCSPN